MQRGSVTTCWNSSVQCSCRQPTLLFMLALGLIEQRYAVGGTTLSYKHVFSPSSSARLLLRNQSDSCLLPKQQQTEPDFKEAFSNNQKVCEKNRCCLHTNEYWVRWLCSHTMNSQQRRQSLRGWNRHSSTQYSFFRSTDYLCSCCRFLSHLRCDLSGSTTPATVCLPCTVCSAMLSYSVFTITVTVTTLESRG